MRAIINTLTTAVLVLTFLFAFLVAGIRLFGLDPYTVLSGSMEPTYHVGSVIYVKDTSIAELEVDMPITYTLENGVVVTHRIVEVLVDENDPNNVKYMVKGDANDDIDNTPIPFDDVIGRPVFSIPYFGYVCNFVQNPPGTFIVIGVLALVVLLVFLPDLFKAVLDEPETEQEESEADGDRAAAEKLIKELSAIRDGLAAKGEQGTDNLPKQTSESEDNDPSQDEKA